MKSQNNISRKEVMEEMRTEDQVFEGYVEDVEAVLPRGKGRPPIPKADKILSNGLSVRQWEWIQKEAKLRHIDAAQLQRMMVDWFIDSIEASRSGPIATPKDDRKFEKLVTLTKKSKKNKRK